jgi:hypothetical protein
MRTRRIFFVALAAALALAGQQLHISPRYQTVYILPMTSSLDQHLASRLTSAHVVWVVLEPASADAVLTDSMDEGFWTWLERTYPSSAAASNRASALRTGDPQPPKQRGTVFLVDPRTKVVLWSVYALPKNSSPAEVDRAAVRIATQLKAAFGKR